MLCPAPDAQRPVFTYPLDRLADLLQSLFLLIYRFVHDGILEAKEKEQLSQRQLLVK